MNKINVLHIIQNSKIGGVQLQLLNLVRTYDRELVRAHKYCSSIYGRIAARLARVPVVITSVHGNEGAFRKKNRKRLLSRVNRQARIDRFAFDHTKNIQLAGQKDKTARACLSAQLHRLILLTLVFKEIFVKSF